MKAAAKSLFVLTALASSVALADTVPTYTFVEPTFNDSLSNGIAIGWDGTNANGKAVSGAGWTGGDPTAAWYPLPCEGADIVFDDRPRKSGKNGTINTYQYGGKKGHPLSFHSISQLATEKSGQVVLRDTNLANLFTVGAGGMTFYSPMLFAGMKLNLAASQPFYVSKITSTANSLMDFQASLKAEEDVVWTLAGKSRLRFSGGDSKDFHGSVVANSAFMFYGTNQHQRLAGKKITLTTDDIGGYGAWPQLMWNFRFDDATTVINTPIELNLRRNNSIASGTSGASVTKSEQSFPWIAMAAGDSETDMTLRFEAPVTGVISNRCLVLGESTGNHSETVTQYNLIGLGRSDQQRMVFAADNSGLTALGDRNVTYTAHYWYSNQWNDRVVHDPGHIVYVNTVLSLAHPHAFGANNSEFNFEFRYGGDINYGGRHLGEENLSYTDTKKGVTYNYYGDNEWWYVMFVGSENTKKRVFMGVVATNGVDVGSGLYIQGNMCSGGSDQYGHGASILLGSDGPGESVFSGPISGAATYSNNSYTGSPELRFQGGKGGSAVFAGKITTACAKVVVGLGDVVFTNEQNNFSSDPYGMRVRSGRLLITHQDAIKHSVGSSLKQEVMLGDWVPATRDVRVYNARRWTMAEVGGTDPKYYSDYQNGLTNNLLEFVTMPTIDGVTLQVGDLVAQSCVGASLSGYTSYSATSTKDDLAIVENWVTNRAPNCAFINGIWEVIDAKHWRRVSWLDQDDEVCAAYGLRIRVREGKKHGGRTYFLSNHENWTYEKLNAADRTDCGFHFGPAKWVNKGNYGWNCWDLPYIIFHDEPSANPDVSFLLKGPLTYDRKILVTDNLSTGRSELGGATAETSSFTGTVTLEKPVVYLTAAAGGTTKFKNLSSTADGGTTLVKVGAGTVDLATTTTVFDGITGLDAREGVLSVRPEYATDRTLAVSIATNGCGCLRIRGSVDLSGSTLAVTAARKVKPFEPQTILEVESGTLTGTPTITGLGPDWTVETTSTKVIATRHKRGSAVYVR